MNSERIWGTTDQPYCTRYTDLWIYNVVAFENCWHDCDGTKLEKNLWKTNCVGQAWKSCTFVNLFNLHLFSCGANIQLLNPKLLLMSIKIMIKFDNIEKYRSCWYSDFVYVMFVTDLILKNLSIIIFMFNHVKFVYHLESAAPYQNRIIAAHWLVLSWQLATICRKSRNK